MTLAISPLASSTGAEPEVRADRPLRELRNKSRVLLVFAPAANDLAYLTQRKLWHEARAGFGERQLIVVPVLGDTDKTAGESPAALARRYQVEVGKFAVVLLGKDGHDAFRTREPVAAEVVYEKIDVMPMRRAEMKAEEAARRGQ